MLTNLKRRSALLLSLAVVCATVAFVPQQAGAVAMAPATLGDDVPNTYTYLKACPGTTAPAAGFTDTTSTDVDCIKMFGITTGKTATTYDPSGTISRQDMARFIHRMFVPTGMAAAGTTVVPTFTDTAHVTADGLAAINALASHGITTGTTATTFSPDDLVTREQMALFLNRFASKVKRPDGTVGLPSEIGTGNYNYTDISTSMYEAMDAIIRLYNLNVTEVCTVALTCATTYRPADNITRAEMATMMVNLLNHTNARPAGVTMQVNESSATAGAKTGTISVRNADFSASGPNTLVDEFFQLHNDSAAVAAQPAFVAGLGTCNASNVTKTGTQTLCMIDSLDKSTDTYGNVAMTSQTTAANKTANWWAWTGTSGASYVDGVTSTGYNLSIALGAAATPIVYADTVTSTISGSNALGKALPVDYSGYSVNLTGNDGIATKAGQSRTVTATLSDSTLTAAGTAHTVVDGYTLKFADKKVDMLGNVTITNTYVPTSGGVATYTVTCGADNSALTTGVGNASSSYWEAHEITISEATATGTAAGTSRPALDATAMATFTEPTDGGHNNTINISCDDAVSTYTKGAASTKFATSGNQVTTSTAGSLMSMTASAYDQYGAGIAGQTVVFQSVTTAAATSVAASAVNVATLTTGADGNATLTAVVCTTASGAASVAWNTDDTGVTMHAIGATAAGSALSAAGEGTTVYCNSAMADGAYTTGTTSADAVTLMTFNQLDTNFGTLTLTICSLDGAETTYGVYTDTCADSGAMAGAGDVSATECQNAVRAATNVDAATTCTMAEAGGVATFTITFPANTGAWTVATKGSHTLADADGGNATVVAHVIDGSGASTLGVAGNVWTFVDDDAATSTVVAKRTREGATTAGAAVLTTQYHKFVYDSTDTFELKAGGEVATAVQGASQAQFATELASLTDHTTPITVTQRTTAVTTTQVSHFRIG